MGIAVIILGLFIVLLVVVIYGLGRTIKELNKEPQEMDNELNNTKTE